jgi:PAS domain S-box-containing protein
MDRELRLLILDDSPAFVSDLAAELGRQGRPPFVTQVSTVSAMDLALDEGSWDAVIADYSMPDFKAAGALDLVRRRGLDLPVVLLSTDMAQEVGMAAIAAGASDYLPKGHLPWIGIALARALREASEKRARREAEAALCAAEARLARADAGGGLVVLCDARGTVLSCSDGVVAMLGYEHEDVVGRNWFQYFLPREERERAEEASLVVNETGRQGTAEYDVVTLLGERRHVRFTITPLVDRAGRVFGTASFGTAAEPAFPIPSAPAAA